jgi:hypothetical protein
MIKDDAATGTSVSICGRAVAIDSDAKTHRSKAKGTCLRHATRRGEAARIRATLE